MQKGINNKQYLYIIMCNDGVDNSLGVVEVGLLGLRPDVVGRVVAGQQDELDVGVGIVNLREHLAEHIPSSALPLRA